MQNIVYPNAPITEAVLDIRVEPTNAFAVDHLSKFVDELRAGYPDVEDQLQMRATIKFGTKDPTAVEQTKVGVIGRTSHNDRAYQVQANGLSISKMNPYRDWLDLKSEAQRLWGIYKKTISPKAVSRIALRYINRIDIPVKSEADLKEYFRTTVEISPDLPQGMSSFLLQVRLPLNDIRCDCVINSQGLPPAKPDTTSVLLDIDIFRTADIPQTDAEMWGLFDILRDRKNSIFEGCITDRTRKLFV